MDMYRLRAGISASTAAMIILSAGFVVAQESEPSAEECLRDLQAFNQRMDDDGYWLSGWGTGWDYGYGVGAPPPPATVPTPPPDGETAAGTTGDPEVRSRMAGFRMGIDSPRYQIRSLHAAATVLAHRGDQQGCEAVLAALRDAYGGYVDELRQAGLEPNEVTTWRQERILAAEPVESLERDVIQIGNVTGTEVRNGQDEELGTVSDVVIDPDSGGIQYVIVSTGGVLGIGEDDVAVPWNILKTTPGLNTFVLDVPEEVMEQAPRVDMNWFADPDQAGNRPQEVDQYWQEHLPS